MRLIAKLLNILAIFMLILPSVIAVSQPKLMQESDFVMDFYTVGAMMSAGQGVGIYPPAGAETFFNAPFDNFCKHLLPYLPKESVAIYMYSPLLALLFAPYSHLPPPQAMVAYQVVCILALIASSFLLCGKNWRRAGVLVAMAALFCPVFHTLLIGQLGIVYGLVPLALAFYFLRKDKQLAAGLAFSLLGLKPQFMPTALLVCGALFFAGRRKATLGLAIGLATFAVVNVLACGPDLFIAWWHNFKMADAIYAKKEYQFGEYLVVCLPAVLLQFFPHAAREAMKLPIYGLSAVIGLYSLWQSILLFKFALHIEDRRVYEQALGLIFILGLVVLTLVVPHFLFYDLCSFVLLAYLAYDDCYPLNIGHPLRLLRHGMWWASNIFFLIFMFLPVGPLKQWFPLTFVALFAYFFYVVIRLMQKVRQLQPQG